MISLKDFLLGIDYTISFLVNLIMMFFVSCIFFEEFDISSLLVVVAVMTSVVVVGKELFKLLRGKDKR